MSLYAAAKKIRDAFDYDPGHSDLDNEQPIHISVTLGDWRALNWALMTADDTEALAEHLSHAAGNLTREEK
jgi:hypothetical protein